MILYVEIGLRSCAYVLFLRDFLCAFCSGLRPDRPHTPTLGRDESAVRASKQHFVPLRLYRRNLHLANILPQIGDAGVTFGRQIVIENSSQACHLGKACFPLYAWTCPIHRHPELDSLTGLMVTAPLERPRSYWHMTCVMFAVTFTFSSLDTIYGKECGS